MKTCYKCEVEKDTSEFTRDASKKDNLNIYCKKCQREKNLLKYHQNIEKSQERVREWRQENPEKYKETREKYYLQNKDKISEYRRQYHKTHREEYNAWRREYRRKLKSSNPEIALFEASKRRAKLKGIEHTLQLEDIKIPEICPVLGIPLKVSPKVYSDNSPSIDRIDNSKGYTKDNIIVVSWKANDLKGQGTTQELEKIVNFYKNLK